MNDCKKTRTAKVEQSILPEIESAWDPDFVLDPDFDGDFDFDKIIYMRLP